MIPQQLVAATTEDRPMSVEWPLNKFRKDINNDIRLIKSYSFMTLNENFPFLTFVKQWNDFQFSFFAYNTRAKQCNPTDQETHFYESGR